jgi:ketosteroid isomerase-like protein
MQMSSFGNRALAALIPVFLLCVPAFADDDVETIRALRMQSNEAIAGHDARAVGSFLQDDFVITISTGAIERSRDEHIENFARHFEEFPDVVYIRTPSSITISEDYPLAIEQGTWVGARTTANGELENGGEYTAAWRKTDSGWKIYSELYVGLYCRGADC